MGIRDAERDAICYTKCFRQPAERVGRNLHQHRRVHRLQLGCSLGYALEQRSARRSRDCVLCGSCPPCGPSHFGRGTCGLGVRGCGGAPKFLCSSLEDARATCGAPGLLTHPARTLLGLECTVVERSIAQHGPQDAGEFACESDDGNLLTARLCDVIAPAFYGVGARARAQDRPCRLDEQCARLRVALFGNPAQASLRRASRCGLARD